MNNTLKASIVRELVSNAGSKIFSVTFIKKDGSIRKVNGQLVASPPTHKGYYDLFSVHLMNGQGVRTVSYNKVLRLASAGEIYQVSEA